MIFDFYNKFGALNSAAVFEAFSRGLKKHGHTVYEHSGMGDVAVIWSVLWAGRMVGNRSIWNLYRNNKKPVIVLEIGAIKRDITWKIGINGINSGSYFAENKNDDRRKLLGMNLAPWKNSGNHILICNQHDRSLQWESNPSLKDWTHFAVNEIRKYSDRPIKIRMHPRCPYSFNFSEKNVQRSTEKNILDEFRDAWAVVNYSSNPGIESVLHGIPAFVGAKSLAAPVANLDLSKIENPLRPDREQWLNDLAWTEWTLDEIASGIPQEHLLYHLQFSRITGS